MTLRKDAEKAVDGLVKVLRDDNSPEYAIGYLSAVITYLIVRLPPEVAEREIGILKDMTTQIVDEKEMRLRGK